MPNFSQGVDLGDILGHPSSNDTLVAPAGPYRTTYNGLRRTSSGLTDNDTTADSLRLHIDSYNYNLDKTLSVFNLTATGQSLKIPFIDALGTITLNKLRVTSINVLEGVLNEGVTYGGSLESMDGTAGLSGTSWDGGTY